MNPFLAFLSLLPLPYTSPPQVPLHINPALIDPNFEMTMDEWLFPDWNNYSYAWTTSPVVPHSSISIIDLSDEALGVHRVDTRRPPHTIVTAPNVSSHLEQKAWRILYPKGSINPNGKIPGGVGFHISGPRDFQARLDNANEIIYGYSVLFEEGFEWVKGGKLPGGFGGVEANAYHCTGGRKEQRDTCYNLRLMWRKDGDGELYAYLPMTDENTAELLNVPPKSIKNPDYGFSVGRGSFRFLSGSWVTLVQRIKLNDVGVQNGEIEIRANGKVVIFASGLTIRTTPNSSIKGIHFESFFGGHTPEWASPKDQYAYFTNISGAIIN